MNQLLVHRKFKDHYLFKDPSLVLYLPLYELDGASFRSKDRYGHLCVVTGPLWTPQDRTFDGDDKIVVTANAALQNFTAKSVVVWAKINAFAADYRELYDNGYWTSTFGDFLWLSKTENGYAWYFKNTAGTVKQAPTSGWVAYTPNTWTMLAYSWDGATITAYKNTSVVASDIALTGTLACSSYALTIGSRSNNSEGFTGSLGEVLIYNRALTATEIAYLYHATKWRYP